MPQREWHPQQYWVTAMSECSLVSEKSVAGDEKREKPKCVVRIDTGWPCSVDGAVLRINIELEWVRQYCWGVDKATILSSLQKLPLIYPAWP